MSEKLVLIDGHSIVHRAFYGIPDLTNSEGFHTNAIYGFLNILFRLLDEEKPDYLVVTFDEHAPTFRHEMFAEYKGTRKPMPEELRQQIPVLRELLNAMKVTTISVPGLEADDLMGTLAKKAQADGMEVSLVSGDRDLLQIADEHILIRIPKTNFGKTTIEDYRPEDVIKTFQVDPHQFIELKALMGDTADNIPGVPKIGTKTATELMVTYGSIENIYANLNNITKKSVRETLAANRELADLSLRLATIKIDCPVELDKEASKAEGYFTPEAYEIMKRLEFKKLLDRFSEDVSKASGNIPEELIECSSEAEFLGELKKAAAKECGIHIICDSETVFGVAACFYEGDKVKRIVISNMLMTDILVKGINEVSANAKGMIYFSNIKPQYICIASDNIAHYFDTLLGAYLINPLKNDYDAQSVALEYLGITMPSERDRIGKLSYSEAMLGASDGLSRLAADIAYVALEGGRLVSRKLEKMNMSPIMRDIEMPLTAVLYSMEAEGVRVNREELKAYGESLNVRIIELEKQIHEAAGEDFNINSPKQLGEILFDKMQIPGGKKTKTGYSTAADVLERLAVDYPFVEDILEYRTLTKLKSTYAEGLACYIGEDGRIHTTFNQMITATGRISSTEPNLQNIPIRTEIGRELRKIFIPRDGYVFVDADYSQVELRILASMSGDEGLISAYNEAKDIHRITASKVFNTPFEEVTDLQRRNAKAVNFGIVYGISSFGLSQDLSISRKEAQEYIEQYFKTYPQIKLFLDKMVSDAKEKGYSETLFGRRRPIPELSSSNFMQRQFGERVAMNAPIQGTAADIMKLAMIDTYNRIKAAGLKSKMLLQVHDELVIEAAADEKDIVCDILQKAMVGAANLAVKLEIGMESGNNWYEAH